MKIEHDNWSPASKMYDEMDNFSANIAEIVQEASEIPDFNDNIGAGDIPAHVTLHELEERKNQLIRLAAKIDSTMRVLDSVREAYHEYQEMLIENTQKESDNE